MSGFIHDLQSPPNRVLRGARVWRDAYRTPALLRFVQRCAKLSGIAIRIGMRSVSLASAMKIKVLHHVAWALLLSPAAALAHHFMDDALPQTWMQGLLSGLGHPLIGIDHAAFIVAAGFLLALVARGLWGIAALIGGSLAGAVLHLAGIALPYGETGVALSVLLIGGVITARHQLSLAWLAVGFALAGVLHGHAYAETIFGAEAAPLAAYLTGFSLTQFGVAATALLLHRKMLVHRTEWATPLSAILGTLTGGIGVSFLYLTVAG